MYDDTWIWYKLKCDTCKREFEIVMSQYDWNCDVEMLCVKCFKKEYGANDDVAIRMWGE